MISLDIMSSDRVLVLGGMQYVRYEQSMEHGGVVSIYGGTGTGLCSRKGYLSQFYPFSAATSSSAFSLYSSSRAANISLSSSSSSSSGFSG